MESGGSLVYQARVSSRKVTRKVLYIKANECLLQHHERFEALQMVIKVGGAIVNLHGGCLEPLRNRLLHDGLGEGRSHGESDSPTDTVCYR